MKQFFIPVVMLLFACNNKPIDLMKAEFEKTLAKKVLDPKSTEILKFDLVDTLYWHNAKETRQMLKKLSNNSADTLLNKAIDQASGKNMGEILISFMKIFEEKNSFGLLAAYYNTYELRNKIEFDYDNFKVIDVLIDEIRTIPSDSIIGYNIQVVYRTPDENNELKIITNNLFYDPYFNLKN